MTAPNRSEIPAAPGLAAPAAPDVGAMIDHVVSRFHEAHRRQLPELVRLAERVETVHRDDPDAPLGLAQILRTTQGELTRHMMKEEIVVFPRMRRNVGAPLDQRLAELSAEHDAHGEALARIRALSHDFTAPEGACGSWRALAAGLAEFADDLERHVAFENDVLFPVFRN